MPAKSRKQQRFLAHKFGWKWVKAHHMDRVQKKSSKKK